MSETKQPATSKTPSHIAYHVRDLADGESFWTRIGSAWVHADGKGFSIQTDIMPLDGRITLRLPSDKPK